MHWRLEWIGWNSFLTAFHFFWRWFSTQHFHYNVFCFFVCSCSGFALGQMVDDYMYKQWIFAATWWTLFVGCSSTTHINIDYYRWAYLYMMFIVCSFVLLLNATSFRPFAKYNGTLHGLLLKISKWWWGKFNRKTHSFGHNSYAAQSFAWVQVIVWFEVFGLKWVNKMRIRWQFATLHKNHNKISQIKND